MATFDKWLDTLIEEKGFDTDHIFEVDGPSGENWIPLELLLEAIKAAPANEQAGIKSVIVKLDFMNRDIMDYFRRLCGAIAV